MLKVEKRRNTIRIPPAFRLLGLVILAISFIVLCKPHPKTAQDQNYIVSETIAAFKNRDTVRFGALLDNSIHFQIYGAWLEFNFKNPKSEFSKSRLKKLLFDDRATQKFGENSRLRSFRHAFSRSNLKVSGCVANCGKKQRYLKVQGHSYPDFRLYINYNNFQYSIDFYCMTPKRCKLYRFEMTPS